MPLYQYKCVVCDAVYEKIFKIQDKPKAIQCHKCGNFALSIISIPGVNCSNDDSPWVRSVVDVVDKKSKNPATQEFIKNPTRANLKKHLQANGLRHADPGEKFGKVSPDFDVAKHTDKVVRYRQEKNAIRVNG